LADNFARYFEKLISIPLRTSYLMRFSAKIIFALLISVGLVSLTGCSDFGLDVHKIDDHFYVILGDGGNSGVLIGDTSVLVIDTKMKQSAERLHQWVDNKAKGKKVYIINTHIHKDHTGGNHLYDHPTVIAGDYGVQFWNAANAKEDMPNVWLSDSLVMNFGEETVLIKNIGQAHTYDDVIVYLEKHKTLFTGDVVLNKYHPYLDEHVGSSVDNYISAQTKMLDLYADVTVVPGHGDIGESQLIFDFRQYMLDMKDAASNPDDEEKMREKYIEYSSIPINKAGFDQTLQYIRKSETLRM